MIDVTDKYVNVPRALIRCPDCGGFDIALFDDFNWFCHECGCTIADRPECYLSPEEVIDWKAGMWEPKKCPKKVRA